MTLPTRDELKARPIRVVGGAPMYFWKMDGEYSVGAVKALVDGNEEYKILKYHPTSGEPTSVWEEAVP